MAPAIALARDGFPIGPHLAKEIGQNLSALRAVPALATIFLNADGTPHVVGDTIRMPALAATLERIASGGADAFYRGPVAAALSLAVHDAGGILATSDLARYRPAWRRPLRGTYRGLEVFRTRFPGSDTLLVGAGGTPLETLLGGTV
jgi:gamma-glutamyltranspeptidase/glutathione hydrolase